jgi:proteasome lid subunit RPN8/RPN11
MGAEDHLVSAVAYGRDVLARIAALCEADPEREVCGFVVRRAGTLEVVPVENVADRYHALDTERFPRTSRESYLMDPRALLRVHEDLDEAGGDLVAVWHSHVEVGAYFSPKDRADALVDGAPLLPGTEYLVVGVSGGRAHEVKRFRFEAGGFVEAALP